MYGRNDWFADSGRDDGDGIVPSVAESASIDKRERPLASVLDTVGDPQLNTRWLQRCQAILVALNAPAPTWLAAVLGGILPSAFGLLAMLLIQPASTAEIVGLVCLVPLNSLALWLPQRRFGEFAPLATELELLMPDLRDRRRVATWFTRRADPCQQRRFAAIGGLTSFVSAIVLQHDMPAREHVSLAFVLAVTLTGIYGINVVYWLETVPSTLKHTCESKELWLSPCPFYDEVLRDLIAVFSRTARHALAALWLFTTPILLCTYYAHGHRAAQAIGVLALVTPLVILYHVGLLPWKWLFQASRAYRARVGRELRKRLPRDPLMSPLTDAELDARRHYIELHSVRMSFIDRNSIVQVLATVVVAFCPYIPISAIALHVGLATRPTPTTVTSHEGGASTSLDGAQHTPRTGGLRAP